MATFEQPSAMFVPPGAAGPMPAMAAPASVHITPYYRYHDPRMALGGTGMVMPVIAAQPPNYEYTPNDFTVLSLTTVILCGVFSPLSLLLSLPALFYSQQSKKNAVIGAVKTAKRQGMIAAYLNVTAIVAALVVACLVMGLVLGLYGPVYAQQQYCNSYYYECQYYSSYCTSYCRYY